MCYAGTHLTGMLSFVAAMVTAAALEKHPVALPTACTANTGWGKRFWEGTTNRRASHNCFKTFEATSQNILATLSKNPSHSHSHTKTRFDIDRKRVTMSDRPMSQDELDYALDDAATKGDAVEAERVIALKANVNYDVCFRVAAAAIVRFCVSEPFCRCANSFAAVL